MVDGKKRMFELIESFPEQIRLGYELGKDIHLSKPSKVIFCGMGGSAIAGSLITPFLESCVPVIVNRFYDLPQHVDKNAWVVLISYSGNTEETIALFDEAISKGFQVFCITSGGELELRARKKGVQLIMLPSGLPPRASLGFQFFAILRVMVEHKLIDAPNIPAIVAVAKDKGIHTTAKTLAAKCKGTVPLIYASEKNLAVSYRWKTQFNENAKVHAFSHSLPELDHNEILGYTKRFAKFFTVFLQYSSDHIRVKKRMQITQKLIKPSQSVIIQAKGKTDLEQFAYFMHLGDLTSYYLALSIKVDPYPVEVIERLKKELKK